MAKEYGAATAGKKIEEGGTHAETVSATPSSTVSIEEIRKFFLEIQARKEQDPFYRPPSGNYVGPGGRKVPPYAR